MILHPIVLAEIYYFLRKQNHEQLYPPYIRFLEDSPLYLLDDIAWADLSHLQHILEIPEMHDRLIAVAAKRLNLPIVTADATIHACKQVRCVW